MPCPRLISVALQVLVNPLADARKRGEQSLNDVILHVCLKAPKSLLDRRVVFGRGGAVVEALTPGVSMVRRTHQRPGITRPLRRGQRLAAGRIGFFAGAPAPRANLFIDARHGGSGTGWQSFRSHREKPFVRSSARVEGRWPHQTRAETADESVPIRLDQVPDRGSMAEPRKLSNLTGFLGRFTQNLA